MKKIEKSAPFVTHEAQLVKVSMNSYVVEAFEKTFEIGTLKKLEKFL